MTDEILDFFPKRRKRSAELDKVARPQQINAEVDRQHELDELVCKQPRNASHSENSANALCSGSSDQFPVTPLIKTRTDCNTPGASAFCSASLQAVSIRQGARQPHTPNGTSPDQGFLAEVIAMMEKIEADRAPRRGEVNALALPATRSPYMEEIVATKNARTIPVSKGITDNFGSPLPVLCLKHRFSSELPEQNLEKPASTAKTSEKEDLEPLVEIIDVLQIPPLTPLETCEKTSALSVHESNTSSSKRKGIASTASPLRAHELVQTEAQEQINVPCVGEVVTERSDNEDRRLDLEQSWGIPRSIKSVYEKECGIKGGLFPWQIDCLLMPGVLDGSNLVFAVPTSGGKTIVAEILLIRMLLSTRKKALFILPFVSIVAEKVVHLTSICQPARLKVRGYHGGQGGSSLPPDVDVAVCTIEKANGVVNRLIEERRIEELAMVVVDELHMVGDPDRGYLLELTLTKLRYIHPGPLQIVGMSATLPNIESLAAWLGAELYVSSFRPVPLTEFIMVDDTLYDPNGHVVRKISSPKNARDPDMVVPICVETLCNHHSVLIFCESKLRCEKTSLMLANELPKAIAAAHAEQRGLIVEQLRRTPGGLDANLAATVLAGVAYHHAGLTQEERAIIETGYREGFINVLVATSTLAAGVNLPARRVIFRTPKIGRDLVDVSRYKQMSGRAGRMGKDTLGESIVMCKRPELPTVVRIINSPMPSLESCLASNSRQDRRAHTMSRALLEVIAGGVVETVVDVARYITSTLLSVQRPYEDVHSSAKLALEFLEKTSLISWSVSKQRFEATALGLAVFASSLCPEEALLVHQDLLKARRNFIMECELHLIYLVTPPHHGIEPDWVLYLRLYSGLPKDARHVADLIGVDEAFLTKAQHIHPTYQSRDCVVGTHRRFFVALMLWELVREVPIHHVARRYGVERGPLQSAQALAATFAGMVSAFCQRLNWIEFDILISSFQERLNHGVRADLLELVQVPFVKAYRARVLYAAGLRTVQALAASKAEDVLNILLQASPHRSSTESQSLNSYEYKIMARSAKEIVQGAMDLVKQRAQELEEKASGTKKALSLAKERDRKAKADRRAHRRKKRG